jgi:hypothetical protein
VLVAQITYLKKRRRRALNLSGVLPKRYGVEQGPHGASALARDYQLDRLTVERFGADVTVGGRLSG